MSRPCHISITICVALLIGSPAMAVESKIGPAGQVILDGTPVVPVGVWAQPTYLFEYHRQLGATCIVAPAWERAKFADDARDIAGAADRTGLGLIPNFRRRRSTHPNTWGYINNYVDPKHVDRLRRSYARIKEADPTRFVMTNITIDPFIVGQHEAAYIEAFKHTDAVISHVWPELRDPTTHNIRNVGAFIDRVRRYCRGREGGEVSIWVELNPHKWKLKDRSGGAEFRAPTRAEFKFQVWLALIHGADGIVMFPISFDPFVFCQIPAQNEQEIAVNAALIKRMTPALTAPESTLAIEVTSDQPDGIVDVTTRHIDGAHYVFVLNGGTTAQTVTLTAPGLGEQWTLIDAIGDKPLAVTDREYAERLDGLALRIWKLQPKQASPAAHPSDE